MHSYVGFPILDQTLYRSNDYLVLYRKPIS